MKSPFCELFVGQCTLHLTWGQEANIRSTKSRQIVSSQHIKDIWANAKKIIYYNLINHLCFVLVEFRKLYLFGVANPIPELEIVTDVSCTDAFLFENAYFLMCSHLASTLKRRKTPMKTGIFENGFADWKIHQSHKIATSSLCKRKSSNFSHN